MIHRLWIQNDGTDDDPSWTLSDQDENYLDDDSTLPGIIEKAKTFGEAHGVDEVTIRF